MFVKFGLEKLFVEHPVLLFVNVRVDEVGLLFELLDVLVPLPKGNRAKVELNVLVVFDVKLVDNLLFLQAVDNLLSEGIVVLFLQLLSLLLLLEFEVEIELLDG